MSDSIQMPVSIAKGLAKAQIYARGVSKSGQNKAPGAGGYFYATSEDIIVEARRALAEGGGIFFSSVGWDYEPIDGGPARTKTDGAKTKTLATTSARVIVRYRLISIDTGETYYDSASAPVVPDFGRPDDKASFGTLTECIAYTLRGLLNLPRGVEGAIDMNQRDDSQFVPSNQRDDTDPPSDRPSADRRADYTPRDERPPSDRPSAEVPRSGARAAADRAVEAQTRGPVAQVPTYDPAHLALCDDFVRRARIADIGEGREEPADIHDLILKSDLPKPLRDQALVAVYRRASEIVDDPDVLDGWIRAALSAALDEGQKATLRACFAAADERISKLPPIDAAA